MPLESVVGDTNTPRNLSKSERTTPPPATEMARPGLEKGQTTHPSHLHKKNPPPPITIPNKTPPFSPKETNRHAALKDVLTPTTNRRLYGITTLSLTSCAFMIGMALSGGVGAALGLTALGLSAAATGGILAAIVFGGMLVVGIALYFSGVFSEKAASGFSAPAASLPAKQDSGDDAAVLKSPPPTFVITNKTDESVDSGPSGTPQPPSDASPLKATVCK